MIFAGAQQRPDAIALDDLRQQRSWAELEARVWRLTRLLREELGLAPGAHAALLMENRIEIPELIVTALVSGIWLTPINRHLAREEIEYVLGDSGAGVVFTDAEHAEIARGAGAAHCIELGPAFDAQLAALDAAPLPLTGAAGGNMIYTSGTSGRPKGVKRRPAASAEAALAAGRAYGQRIGLDGSGPHLATGPLYHSAPLMYAVYDLLAGAPTVIMRRWDETQALELLQEREIHHTHLVPTMFVRLLRLPEEQRRAFRAPALHRVIHGAAPVARAIKQRMIEWWGPILYEYWGGTEGGVASFVDSQEWLAHPGTVGRALAPFEIFAVGEDGRVLPPGETGLLYSRHTQIERCFEYHRAPEKTHEAFLDANSFTLGDIGHVDADGYVFLADRKSHMIISGGVNIYPAEIEQVLIEHPAVADAGVFGIPDEEWGEQVKAAIELRPGFEPSPQLAAGILAFAREHLAGYKVPRSIDFERELPRHPTGKLLIRRLREPYWQATGRRI